MSRNRQLRWPRLTLLVPLFVLGLAGTLAAQDDDLVEQFRDRLPFKFSPFPPRDDAAKGLYKKALAEREQKLREIAEKMRHRLGDLRAVLQLREWRDKEISPLLDDPEVIKQDERLRSELGEDFLRQIRVRVQGKDVIAQQAVATMLGEMGSAVSELYRIPKGAKPGERISLGPELQMELIQLMKAQAPEVRQEAARAVGKVIRVPAAGVRGKDPMLDVAVKALDEMLTRPGADAGDRQAAAQGLLIVVRGNRDPGQPAPMSDEERKQSAIRDLLPAAILAVPVAAKGLRPPLHADPQLRRLLLETIKEGSALLKQEADNIQGGLRVLNLKLYSPTARVISPGFAEEVKDFARRARGHFEQRFRPLLKGFVESRLELAQAVNDSESANRLLARDALELLATARVQLRQIKEKLPVGAHTVQDFQDLNQTIETSGFTELFAPAVASLSQYLGNGDPQVRLRGIEFLERVDEQAIPALAALLPALEDCVPFIRWAAVRTLGRIAPRHPEIIVPAAARLLADLDYDVRLSAAETLEKFSAKEARPALPALVAAAGRGDAEVRMVLLMILAQLARGGEELALPVLIQSLSDPDVSVRLTAAETLGRLGPPVRAAVPALRQALRDENPAVRNAASAALLNLQ